MSKHYITHNQGTKLSDILRVELNPAFCRDLASIDASEALPLGMVLAEKDGVFSPYINATTAEACGILAQKVEALAAPQEVAILARACKVLKSGLIFSSSVGDSDKTDAVNSLKKFGLIVVE